MPMVVVNLLKYFHLLTVMLAFGGAITQMVALAKSRDPNEATAAANEQMNLTIFRAVLFPGLMTALLLGVILAFVTGRFSEPWIHAKLTLVLIWVVLAHMQLRGAKRMIALRQAGDHPTLEKTKGVQLNLARGIVVLVLLIVYLAVFQLDAF